MACYLISKRADKPVTVGEIKIPAIEGNSEGQDKRSFRDMAKEFGARSGQYSFVIKVNSIKTSDGVSYTCLALDRFPNLFKCSNVRLLDGLQHQGDHHGVGVCRAFGKVFARGWPH